MTLLAALLLTAHAGPPSGTVVVLPPEGAEAWVAEAVADMLPRDLALLGVPSVELADLLSAQEDLAIPPVPLTRATSIRVAEALGASRLVIGSHEARGETVTLSLRLLDVERGTLSAPLRVTGPLAALAGLVHGLAWDIALAGPTPPSGTREQFLARRPAVPFEALRAYAQGLAGGDMAARVGLLKRALALAPGHEEARLALGRLQLQARDHGAAHETLSRVPAASPLARTARYLQGVALLELGRYHEAAALYAALAAEDPTPAVLNNHALALLRLGRGSVKASDVLRKAVEMAPGLSDLRLNLGWSLLAEGDAEAAAFWLRGVTRQRPADPQARLVLVWALRQAGRGEEADELWKGLTSVAPSYEGLAAADLSRRFERILPSEHPLAPDEEGRSDAELAAVHVGRAEKLREAGDAESALGELRVSLWCRDDNAVRLELAVLLKELGRTGEARAQAAKVLKADPSNAAAQGMMRENQ